jgi:hypothetical protein
MTGIIHSFGYSLHYILLRKHKTPVLTCKGKGDMFKSPNFSVIQFLIGIFQNYLTWIYTSPLYGIVYQTKDYSTNTIGAHAILDGSSPYIGIKILDVKPNLPQSASKRDIISGLLRQERYVLCQCYSKSGKGICLECIS